jgi:hypothetical protein
MRHFRQNLLEAQKRREYILQSKTALAHVSNEKKARAANSIKQRRFSEDQSTKLRAHELKMLHQQEKLLTNVSLFSIIISCYKLALQKTCRSLIVSYYPSFILDFLRKQSN